MPKIKSLSEKNTKREILEAYSELLTEMGETDVTKTTQKNLQNTSLDIQKFHKETVSKINELVDAFIRELSTVTSALTEASESLQQTISTRLVLDEQIKQEEKQIQKVRKQKQEEFEFDLDDRKRVFERELKKKEEDAQFELGKQREDIQNKQKEFADLKKREDTFDSVMEKTVKEAIEGTKKELLEKHNQQVAFSSARFDAEKKLYLQKIETLEKSLVEKTAEISRLQKSVTESSEQVTRIAERAVEKGASSYSPTITK